MNTVTKDVIDVLGGGHLYLADCPYRWTIREWQTMWDCLVGLAPEKAHYLGVLVVSPDAEAYKEYDILRVIDGQQRITTLLVMLAALRDVADEVDLVDPDMLYPRLHRLPRISHAYAVDREAYSAIARTVCPDLDSIQEGAIKEAYLYFRRQWESVDSDRLPSLRVALLRRFRATVLTLGAEDDPAAVYQTLNHREPR